MIAILIADLQEISLIREDIIVLISEKDYEIFKFKIIQEEVVGVLVNPGKMEYLQGLFGFLKEKFEVEFIINIGIAGAIDKLAKIGDIYISMTAGFKCFGDKACILFIREMLNYNNIYYGRIISSDQLYIEGNRYVKDRACIDMEAEKIYIVAEKYNIECLFIKGISDNANSNSERDILLNISYVSNRLKKYLLSVIPKLDK